MTTRSKPTFNPVRLLLVCGAMMFTLFATSMASAQGGCQSDADCGSGEVCQVVATAGCDCAPCPDDGSECRDCGCEETTWSECVTPPPTCASDADCATHLTCIHGGDTPCSIACDENGECTEDCPEPDPNAPGYCDFVPSECASDADCAEGFACEQWGSGTCAVACDENGECTEDCSEPEATGGSCFPQEIECDTDADCPTSWTCYAFVSQSCSGGGSTGCACPSCAPDEPCEPCDCADEEPIEDPIDCTEETNHWCIPDGWEEWVESYTSGGVATAAEDAASGDPRSPFGGEGSDDNQDSLGGGNGGNDDDGGSSSSGGCAVASPNTTVPGAGLLLLAALGLLVVRRRR